MDAWQTHTFEFEGGLVSNLSPLQHGAKIPGSAATLKNFEPSVDGGYRRILGFTKYDDAYVPTYGSPVVQGSGQTGTTLLVANLYDEPVDGDTFTIDGVDGTYQIDVGGVSYNSSAKTATLTLTTALDSSPSDQASIVMLNTSSLIRGVVAWKNRSIAFRDNCLYESTGGGWTRINVPSYGTCLVNGASQTGTTLAIDGLTATPNVGDNFTISGVEQRYTVMSTPTVTAGATTLSILPALASSPADNAAITWRTSNYSNGVKIRTSKHRIGATDYVIGVDGENYPFKWDGTTFSVVKDGGDIVGAQHCVFYKNQMFYAKDNLLSFTAPYTNDDFSAANGAGSLLIDGNISGMIVFKEVLLIFTQSSITQLTGNTSSDFQLQPVTRNIGCVSDDTLQEIGGDVVFLGPDGLRSISATTAFGDLSLGNISKQIQTEMTQAISSSSSFSSVVINKKSQYRLFGYNATVSNNSAKGLLFTQKDANSQFPIEWAEIVGFKAFVCDNDYRSKEETTVFANASGYVYEMENGNSLDGDNIIASFSTPYVFINDPSIRKTFYRLNVYTDPQGSVNTYVNLKYDFDTEGSIQPLTINFSNAAGSIDFYGSTSAVYGVTVYGSKLKKIFSSQTIGSGFFVSLQFYSEGISPPFSLDAATLEYSSHDRR